MWSLGVILCNLAFGRNPWAQAVATDATFAAYAANPVYLTAILPASPSVARILTGPRGLFSLDPRRRMSLKELRQEVMMTARWTMNDDEVRFASPEARSVAGVIRNAVRERDARLGITTAPPAPSQRRPEQLVIPQQQQQIFVPSVAPTPAPVRPSLATQQAHHGRNSSLRLVLQKVAAPFTSSSSRSSSSFDTDSSSPQSGHLRRPSVAPTASSSSSSYSLDSPMPLTPPASSYNSDVDVMQPGGVAYAWPSQSPMQGKTASGARSAADWNGHTVNVVPVVGSRR